MIEISGLKTTKIVKEGKNLKLHQCEIEKYGSCCICEIFSSSDNDKPFLLTLKEEYKKLQNILSKNIPQVYDVITSDNGITLVYEDFAFLTLSDFTKKYPVDISMFFSISIQIAEVLETLHLQGLVHKGIQPENIFIDENTLLVKLGNWGIWQLFPERSSVKNLAYFSPEQTERMNRTLDYRTDFYSLGITLYELLTGTIPFPDNDLLSLTHSHIAKMPELPHEIRQSIPAAISDIVMKLLAKNPEDRYQSSYGIKKDLDICFDQWQRTKQIENFIPAVYDFSYIFNISQKFYGKKNEIDTLLDAAHRVSKGSMEFVLVSGLAGVGKSSLIQEMKKHLLLKNAYFISGKYPLYSSNIPYSAILESLHQLIQQILTENDDQIAFWKTEFLQKLGENAAIIQDIIPEIQHIIGTKKALEPIPYSQEENRFLMGLQKFLSLFGKTEHSIILFLDDMQWIDSASLNFLKNLLSSRDMGHFLLIGTIRSEEWDLAHPLLTTMKELKEDLSIKEIDLQFMALEDISDLLEDTLRCPKEKAEILAKIVHQKTWGHPFFVKDFIDYLYKNNFIQYDPHYVWKWDNQQISEIKVADNLATWITGKIQLMENNFQHFLRVASCLGEYFGLKILGIVLKKEESEIVDYLSKAKQDGLIFQTNSGYCFAHDRIREACYSLLSREEVHSIHLSLAKFLAHIDLKEELSHSTISIMAQIQEDVEFLVEEKDKIKFAELYWQAGKKIKNTVAADYIMRYLDTAKKFLSSDSWQSHHSLCVSIYRLLAECKALVGNIQEAEQTFYALLQNCIDPMEKSKIYCIMIEFYTTISQYKKAVSLGLDGLKLLDVCVPSNPGKLSFIWEWIKLQKKLFNRDLQQLPAMKEEKGKAIMRILSQLNDPAYFFNKILSGILILKSVENALLYGNSYYSAFAYINYGILLCMKNDFSKGNEFGRLGLKILEQFPNQNLKCKLFFLYASLIHSWTTPLRENENFYKDSLHAGMETGLKTFSGYSIVVLLTDELITGQPLTEFQKKYLQYWPFVKKTQFQENIDILKVEKQMVDYLQSPFSNELLQTITKKDNAFSLLSCPEENNCLYFSHILKIQLLFLFGEYTQASKLASPIENRVKEIFSGQVYLTEYYFYYALCLAKEYPTLSSRKDKGKSGKLLLKIQNLFKTWAKLCPENFLTKLLLVEAELFLVLGNKEKAKESYNQAIEIAQKNTCLHLEAMGYELAGQLYLQEKAVFIANAYFKEAYKKYQKWGAVSKAEHLKKMYPEFLEEQPVTIPDSSFSPSSKIDLQTLLKAVQSITQEVEQEKLLHQLILIMMENAGAEKGFLFLEEKENKDNLQLVAKGIMTKEGLKVFVQKDLQQDLCISIINYIKRSKETIILGNALQEWNRNLDAYLLEYAPKSILCFPILKQKQSLGLFYFENNLMYDAFSAARIEILKILSSQAAISLENTQFYKNLQEETLEHQKTASALRKSNVKLNDTLLQLYNTQQYAIKQEKLKTLGQMASGIAHDFNNALGIIVGYLDMLLKNPKKMQDQEKLLHYLNTIYVAADDASKVVKRMQNFYRLPGEDSTLKPVDLKSIIQQVILLTMPRWKTQAEAEGSNISFDTDLADTPMIIACESELREMFTNFIFNSVDAIIEKATKTQEKIIIKTQLEDPRLKEEIDMPVYAILTITDTGIGMSDHVRQHCFTPYFSTKKNRGTGIGLSMVSDIIQRHKGTIQVESELGKGTTFTLRFPTCTTSYPEIKIEEPEEFFTKKLRILIVEDDLQIQKLVMEFLLMDGNEVEVASNGAEGLKKFMKDSFDIVITDRAMPQMSGNELAIAIKKISPKMPVIMMTGFGDMMQARNEKPEGIDHVLAKPITKNRLKKVIAQFIEQEK